MSETTSDDDAETGAAADDRGVDHPGDDGHGRRRLLRIVVALAFGVPLVVEGATLLGFLREAFGGGDGGSDGGGAGASTATPPADGVGVDEELFPSTTPNERMRAAVVESTDDGRRFVTTVQVDNAAEDPYELTLTGLTTDTDTRLDAAASTGRVAPGESAVVTGEWSLPDGEHPRRLHATGVLGTGDSAETHDLTATIAVEVDA
jgi:hypothetical protein